MYKRITSRITGYEECHGTAFNKYFPTWAPYEWKKKKKSFTKPLVVWTNYIKFYIEPIRNLFFYTISKPKKNILILPLIRRMYGMKMMKNENANQPSKQDNGNLVEYEREEGD